MRFFIYIIDKTRGLEKGNSESVHIGFFFDESVVQGISLVGIHIYYKVMGSCGIVYRMIHE